MQQRRTFSEEFKREAVKFVRQPGVSKAGSSRDLGIGANLPGLWCRELAKVKTERDILKKALADSTGRRNTFNRRGVYGATGGVDV